MRIFVHSGWFGRGPLSAGMAALAERLKPFGETTYHAWNDQTVIAEINSLPAANKIVVIGFSLGANELGWIDSHTQRRINLGVAYDPSKQSPLCQRNEKGEYVQEVTHYDRLLCYYHPNAWIYGGSKYVGKGVETVEINLPHLAVQFSEDLHRRTIGAVREL